MAINVSHAFVQEVVALLFIKSDALRDTTT